MARGRYAEFCEVAAPMFGDGFPTKNDPRRNSHENCLVDDRPNDGRDPKFLNQSNLLWTELAGIASAFDVHSHSVQLPRSLGLVLPPPQSVMLLDNGIDTAVVRLQGGSGYTSDNVLAWLRVTTDRVQPGAATHHRTYDLPSAQVQAFTGASRIELSFPSLAAYGFRPERIERMELVLGVFPDIRYQHPKRESIYCLENDVIRVRGSVQEFTFQERDGARDRELSRSSLPSPERAGDTPVLCDARAYPVLWRTQVKTAEAKNPSSNASPKPAKPADESQKVPTAPQPPRSDRPRNSDLGPVAPTAARHVGLPLLQDAGTLVRP